MTPESVNSVDIVKDSFVKLIVFIGNGGHVSMSMGHDSLWFL